MFPELVLLALSLGSYGSFKEYVPKAAYQSQDNDITTSPTELALDCPESDSRYRYPGSCSRFVRCKGSEPYVLSCPPGMSYDPNYGHCRLSDEVNCDDDAPPRLLCAKNEVYTSCGSSCERTCLDLHRTTDCGHQCVETCECRMGYVRESEGEMCIKTEACENANAFANIFKFL